MSQAMKVLVACEYSGIVRDAFLARGHDAWSCDLLPTETNSNRHIQGDVREVLHMGWDLLMVAHPPCTRLCNSGVRWLSKPPTGKTLDDMQRELEEGAALFSDCWNAPIERICIENPVMHRHAKALIRNYQEFSQSVQPWQFGDGEVKRTCLWLKTSRSSRPPISWRAEWRACIGCHQGRSARKNAPAFSLASQKQWRSNGDEPIAQA